MPYQVVNDLTLPSGKTLTINAGVVVKFEAVDVTYGSGNRRNLIVGGTLNLLSTPSQKVVFTSSRDDDYGGDTNGDGTGSQPAPGQWGAIRYDNPNNVLHDAIVRYGGLGYWGGYPNYNSGDYQMVWVAGTAPGTLEIRNCVIERAYNRAIYVDSTQAPNIHDNTIRNCNWGVYLDGSGVPTSGVLAPATSPLSTSTWPLDWLLTRV